MQEDLETIYMQNIIEHIDRGQRTLNASKYLHLRYGPTREAAPAYIAPNESMIESCSEVKDLLVLTH